MGRPPFPIFAAPLNDGFSHSDTYKDICNHVIGTVVTVSSELCNRTAEERTSLPDAPLRSSTPGAKQKDVCVGQGVAEEIVITDVRSLVLPEISSEDTEVSQITENYIPAPFIANDCNGSGQLVDAVPHARKQLVRGFRALNASLLSDSSKDDSHSDGRMVSPIPESKRLTDGQDAFADSACEDFARLPQDCIKVEDACLEPMAFGGSIVGNDSTDRCVVIFKIYCFTLKCILQLL